MSLTRYLPKPSARMGCLWSIIPIKDSIVLEYGPSGTTHFSIGFFSDLNINPINKLYTTHMRENDVAMGDTSTLENAIIEIDKVQKPKVIFIVESSVAAIIGSDVKGICNYMQDKVNAKLVSFTDGGLSNDFSYGIKQTYLKLVKELCIEDPQKNTNKVNILGFSFGEYRASSDIKEIEYLLKEGLGLEIGTVLCGDTSISEIQNMGGNALNIVISDEGLSAANYLYKKYKTPLLNASPYGYKGTLDWLKSISDILGIEIKDKMMRKINDKLFRMREYYSINTRLSGKQDVIVVGNYNRVVGIGNYLKSIGFNNIQLICTHSLSSIYNPDENVISYNDENELMFILKDKKDAFILGNDMVFNMCHPDNIFCRISMPLLQGCEICDNLPLMGLNGADYILEQSTAYTQMVKLKKTKKQ